MISSPGFFPGCLFFKITEHKSDMCKLTVNRSFGILDNVAGQTGSIYRWLMDSALKHNRGGKKQKNAVEGNAYEEK